jgi:hypothetical protein
VEIWAIPHGIYYMEEHPGARPFRYEIRKGDPWTTGAVKVCEHELTLAVPAGINLIAAAVETLNNKKKELMERLHTEMQEIDRQISNLLQLPPPAPAAGSDTLEGELV